MTFVVLTLLSLDVQAQEESEETPVLTFEELGWVPPFQVAAFVDDAGTGDCDRIDARYGRCTRADHASHASAPWDGLRVWGPGD